VTGWRVGWAIAAPALTAPLRKVHDFLTVNAPTPLQHAGILALHLGDDYFHGLAAEYDGRRRYAMEMLEKAGFRRYAPAGAYYVMTDIAGFGAKDDVSFARHLVETVGVAGVPGSSFYQNETLGSVQIRFCFCKNYETLSVARQRLSQLALNL
jgi:aminotransferase